MYWSEVKQELFRFESNIVVSAGAGSGKTAALVELYLRLLDGKTALDQHLEPEEIVAITFTDKAAVEMKERIRQQIRKRLASGDDQTNWGKNLQGLSFAPIATFHSFCARLLRENPVEAGIDPSFNMLDEITAGAEMEGSLDELLETELKTRSPALRCLLGSFPLSGMGRGKGVREHLRDLYHSQTLSGREYKDLATMNDDWAVKADRCFAAGIITLAGLVNEVERILTGKPLVFHKVLKRLPTLYREEILSLDIATTPKLLKDLQGCVSGNWGKEKPLKDELAACLEELQMASCQNRSMPLVSTLLTLTERLADIYRQRKERRGALDFEDLQVKTRDLLNNNVQVREECRQRFPVVMVDEFQDTNPLQKELVSLLCGSKQRLFLVGDPKQSIYRFRGADVTVFAKAQAEAAATGGKTLYFQESFRSREGIIAFVNSLFSQVMQNEEENGSVYGSDDHLEPERRDWDGTPCVELMTLSAENNAGELRELEAAAIAAKIRRLVDGKEGVELYNPPLKNIGNPALKNELIKRAPRFGDIAILFRRFSNLKLFERELRKAAIPYYVVKGRGFYRCQEVLDILNFLRYLEYKGDIVALAGVLRSPLCEISDETLYQLARTEDGLANWEQFTTLNTFTNRIDSEDLERLTSLSRLISHLRPLRDRLSLAELLEEVLTGTDFTSSLLTTFQGKQKAANLRKLIEVSRTFTDPGDSSLRRFVSYITGLVNAESTEAEAVIFAEGENVVRLMTIHQSKGLEFPLVIIPELGAGQPPDHSVVKFDTQLGVGVKLTSPGNPSQTTLAFHAITSLDNKKAATELKRLFYVAVTRSCEYLILSGESARNSGPWRKWIDSFISGPDRHLLKVTESPVGLWEDLSALISSSKDATKWDSAIIAAAYDRSLCYTPPLPSELVFSPTALEDYRQCPRKYFYKAIMGLDEGLFANFLGPQGKHKKACSQEMRPLEKGRLAHLLLDHIDFAADNGTQRIACIQRATRIAADPTDPGVTEVINSVLKLAATPLFRKLADKRLMRECPFILKCYGEASYHIRGTMDLVTVEEDGGEVNVYDYKYINKEGADLEGYRFQLRVYLLALYHIFPGRVRKGVILFLRGGEPETVTCDPSAFEEELLAIMDSIRDRTNEKQFTIRTGCDGSHCPFRQSCQPPLPLNQL